MKWMWRLRRLGALGAAVCVLAAYSLIGWASPSWTLVGGHMSEARELAEAVVLNDGRVLVIGGIRLDHLSVAVDVYNPGTNRWAAHAASLHTGRYLFAATVLRNGHVLVTGGITVVRDENDNPTYELLASTEIYDPTGDTWTAGPDLPFATYAPRAVTLSDGRVLLIGGAGSDGPATSSTAFYDPATAAWTAGPAMSFARLLPDATPLTDGRILVTGGFTNDEGMTSVASAELFDPLTNSWSPAGEVPIGHTLGIATRLPDGRVLVAGGANANVNFTLLASAEIYDPITNTWDQASPMSVARVYLVGGLLSDGSVIVAGGVGPEFNGLQIAELYDSEHDTWTLTAQLSAPRPGMAGAVVGNGSGLFVAGGIKNRETFEMFDTGEVYTLNRPPIAVASADPPATDGVPGSTAAVTLSAAGSSDPENDRLTFTWTEGTTTLASTVDPARTATVGLGVGVHNITLTVNDGFGGIATATVVVTVQDATAPLQALIAELAAQNLSLTAQNQELQQQLSASQQAIADAVGTIQQNLRVSFRDPSFTIPGGTPQAQLQALIRAVVELPRDSRLQLYRNLGGVRREGDGR